MAESAASLHAVITGVVQGVGYRYFVRDLAARSALTGWVRNRADGAVECLLQGPKEELDAAERELWEGPPWARVSAVRVSWEEPQPELSGFRVVS